MRCLLFCKFEFIKRLKQPSTLTEDLVAIFGLPFSICCLYLAIVNNISVENILRGFFMFSVMGMFMHTMLDHERLSTKYKLSKWWYAMPIFISLFLALSYIAICEGGL